MENERFLRSPEFRTVPPIKLDKNHREIIKDVVKTSKLLSEVLVGDLKRFKSENTLLRGLIRRNYSQFCNDKGFKDLQMVRKCLGRLNEIQLPPLLTSLYSCFPPTFALMEKPVESLLLVTQSDLRIVIIRLYQIISLLEKLRDVYTLNAGENCFRRLALGHHWPLALAWLGSVSRICSSVSNSLMGFLKESYDTLMSCYNCKILHDEYPHEDEGLNLPLKLGSSEVKLMETVEDTGVVVERTPEVLLTPAEALLKRGKLIIKTFSTLTSTDSLSSWIKEETAQRKASRKKSLTKPLSAEKWKDCKKNLGAALSVGDARDLLLVYILFPEWDTEKGFPSNWNEILKILSNKK